MATKRDEKKLYKIGDVCRVADVPPYVLRYWETEFPALAPEKSGGGQRLYNDREVSIILRIKQLLYTEGFTIAGAKKKLDAELNGSQEMPSPAPLTGAAVATTTPVMQPTLTIGARSVIETVKSDLRELLKKLS